MRAPASELLLALVFLLIVLLTFCSLPDPVAP